MKKQKITRNRQKKIIRAKTGQNMTKYDKIRQNNQQLSASHSDDKYKINKVKQTQENYLFIFVFSHLTSIVLQLLWK
jgi:hypothetical protein